MFLLGVDGGNTKTIALLARADGQIIGVGRSGCSDVYGAPTPPAAVEQLVQAVDAALASAGQAREVVDAACFSLAGADWQEDYDYLTAEIQRLGLAQRFVLYNDALGSLRAGSWDGTGVVIACGTGIATAARNADGQFWHASFWQETLGGREIGVRALRAVTRAELGIDPPTSLTERILKRCDLPRVEDVLRLFTMRLDAPRPIDLSQFAPLVLDEAERGDPVAQAIVADHARRMADYVLVAARKVGIDGTPFTLVLNGGIFRHEGRVLVDLLRAEVDARAPHVTIVRSRYQPAVGALLLAFDYAHIPVTADVMAQIERTMPSPRTFATAG